MIFIGKRKNMSIYRSEENKIYQVFKDKKIGLALSGGGHRAAVFHLGVLSYLAENGLLENIQHISTVSGGSVVMSIIYKLNGYKFPDSKTYLEKILPQVKPYFLEHSLQGSALLNMLKKLTFINRHSMLSYTLKQNWDINVNLQDIADNPLWSINTTVLETGKSWRIEKSQMGSHDLGYIDYPEIELADAVAASAGFPIGIGPLRLDLDKYNIPKQMIKYQSLLLYDGGLYDNLGVEVLLKNNFSEFSKNIDFVMVSDASKPLEQEKVNYIRRIGRIIDVSTEQIRSLKVRMFHKFLYDNQGDGMYIRIGTEYASLEQDAYSAKSVPTNLKKMSLENFESLQANGYSTAMKMFDKYLAI